jgi:hypothetical protein
VTVRYDNSSGFLGRDEFDQTAGTLAAAAA